MNVLEDDLHIFCSGCGELMRDMGEWPVQFPRDPDPMKNLQRVRRFLCTKCRLPLKDFDKGTPVGIAIIATE